jgi:hypothetical protein
MRKTLLESTSREATKPKSNWLDLCQLCTAEISSEAPNHPLEHALQIDHEGGWRAAVPGKQLIKLTFDSPQHIHHVRLEFIETEVSRSQEFALFVTTSTEPRRDILRQQWSFSPDGSTSEVENYLVELQKVTSIELELDPGRHDSGVFASLQVMLLD